VKKKAEYDGLLICNGPDLEEEWEQAKEWKIPVKVCVNESYKRIKWNGKMYWVSITPESFLFKDGKPTNLIVMRFIPKGGPESLFMEMNDFPPFLVKNGVSMFSALHYLICRGCKKILGIGINLKPWPNGLYNRYEGCPNNGQHVYDNIHRIWKSYTVKDLELHGVTFHSSTLNFEPDEEEFWIPKKK